MYNFPSNPSVGDRANGLEWDGSKWIAVWPTFDKSDFVIKSDTEEQIVAGPLTAESFKGRGEDITHIITDQLKDVNSENASRDDLLIFNGTLWEATDFAFIDTALQFNGGIDVTDSSLYPTTIEDGDLYVANEDGIVAAEWVGIAGTSVIAGNFVGWADSKQRWFLLGDLASSAVTRVAAGTGIDVDDTIAAVPVVSIDRTEVDTWYADIDEFKDLQLEVEENTAQIEINADNIEEITVNIGDINLGDLEANVEANLDAINTLDADAVKKSVTTKQEMVGDLKAKSFEGDGSKLSGILTDQLADVNSAGAARDDFLIYNGSSWEAEGFHIDTELTYQGGIDLTAPMSVPLNNGDLYVNNTAGAVHTSWTGIGGVIAREGNFVGYATNKARWFLLGDLASSSVTDVEGGAGIDVDDSKPAEPVVSIDRTEVDTWYEPKFSKLSAFNKNFGTTAGTVSEGNHLHSQYLTEDQFWKAVTGGIAYTDGNVGIGEGVVLYPAGQAYFTYKGTNVNAEFIRGTSKDGVRTVSITQTGDATFSGTVSASTLFNPSGGGILPGGSVAAPTLVPTDNAGNPSTGKMIIGNNSYKWKDAHFSGTVNANDFAGYAFKRPGSSYGVSISSDGAFKPLTDGTMDLGLVRDDASNYKWKDGHFSGTVNASKVKVSRLDAPVWQRESQNIAVALSGGSFNPCTLGGTEADGSLDLGSTTSRFRSGNFTGKVTAASFVGDGSQLTGIAAGGLVDSVNGKTGVVVLSHTDVGAAAASHTHAYAPTNHTHSEYAPASHTHAYAPTNHTHTEYAAKSHTHSEYQNLWSSVANGISYSSGKVGIGLTNIRATLDIEGLDYTGAPTKGTSGTVALTSGSAAGSGASISFGCKQNYEGFAAIKGYLTSGSNNSAGHLDFYTRKTTTDAAMTRALRISSTGTASFAGDIIVGGKSTSQSFASTGQEAGKRFNVSPNGHVEATSFTSPSNLAGTHGTFGYTFGQGFADAPGNVKATSTIATGKYRATWTAPGNFFAGGLSILGTGAISDFYAYSLNCTSAGFFEHADVFTFENNVKGKQISFMVGAMIPNNSSVNPGRSAKEYEEYLEAYEAASKLEVCGGSHGTIYAEPNDLGLITIHTPYLSDHSAAIAGVKDMVKANRSELPASILLHNGFRLDGKKIILDLDAARADVEEQFTNTLAALIAESQNRALLTGDERSIAVCKEIYAASVERIKKGNAAELTRMLTALSDMSAEFIPLRSL